jgi:hypothetical protein
MSPGRTWNDLNPDVRDAFEQMISSDPVMSKDAKKYRAKMLAGATDIHFKR